MASEPTTLRALIEIGAWALATVCVAILALALVAEVVRRHRPTAPIVGLSDRLTPSTGRRVAIAVLALVSTAAAISGPHGAGADPDLRRWLADDEPVATTTSTTVGPTPPPSTRVPTDRPGHRREWLTDSTTTTSMPGGRDTGGDPRARPLPSSTSTTTLPRRGEPMPVEIAEPTSATAPTPPLDDAPIPAPVPADARAAPVPPASTPAIVPQGDHYVVAGGDCLWNIAAAHLGPHPTARAIDRAWRAIYAANRDAVGDDPGLIHPGLVLTIPTLDPTP